MTIGNDNVHYTAWRLLLKHFIQCNNENDDPMQGFTNHQSMMYWFMRMAQELHRPPRDYSKEDSE